MTVLSFSLINNSNISISSIIFLPYMYCPQAISVWFHWCATESSRGRHRCAHNPEDKITTNKSLETQCGPLILKKATVGPPWRPPTWGHDQAEQERAWRTEVRPEKLRVKGKQGGNARQKSRKGGKVRVMVTLALFSTWFLLAESLQLGIIYNVVNAVPWFFYWKIDFSFTNW